MVMFGDLSLLANCIINLILQEFKFFAIASYGVPAKDPVGRDNAILLTLLFVGLIKTKSRIIMICY